MICHRRRLIFVHIRKTGGTSVEAALMHGEQARHRTYGVDDQPVPLRGEDGRPNKHRMLREFDRRVVDDYFVFTIVRNPWDRVVSRYFWELEQGRPSATGFESFREYVLARAHRPPSQWNVTGDNPRKYVTQYESIELDGFMGVDRVLRFERLQEDFSKLARHLGLDLHPLPRLFESRHDPYWTYYDRETQKIVEEAYQIDVERFGYRFPRRLSAPPGRAAPRRPKALGKAEDDAVVTRWDALRAFCFFVGYPASGHSVVGAHIDAHRQAIVSHELHAMAHIFETEGLDREALFGRIVKRARAQAPARESPNHQRRGEAHRYNLPGLSQGWAESLRVIGDKRGAGTSRCAVRYGGCRMIDRTRQVVQLPLRVFLIVRNPFDMLSARRFEARFDESVETLRMYSAAVSETIEALDDDELLMLKHETFIREPTRTLRRILGFLDLEAYQPYLDVCSDAVFKHPTEPRRQRSWTPAQIERVEEALIRAYPWFDGYAL